MVCGVTSKCVGEDVDVETAGVAGKRDDVRLARGQQGMASVSLIPASTGASGAIAISYYFVFGRTDASVLVIDIRLFSF